MRHIVGLLLCIVCIPWLVSAQSGTVTIDALVVGCGNGIVENGESCDGVNFAGQSCSTLGFSSGSLFCSTECTIITASCVVPAPTSNKSQSTRTSRSLVSSEGSFIIAGVTVPGSKVWVLRNGVRVGSGQSDARGQFQIALVQFLSGPYQFGVFAETPTGFRTSAFVFPFYLEGLATVKFERILMSPTIDTDYSVVGSGQTIGVYGEGSPVVTVSSVLYQNGVAKRFATTTSDSSGRYQIILSTIGLPNGDYTVLSYVTQQGRISGPSRVVGVRVGAFEIPRFRDFTTCAFVRGDLDGDCRVNFIDIELAQSWSRGGDYTSVGELERLSGDGRIDMRDFSIILYNWTG